MNAEVKSAHISGRYAVVCAVIVAVGGVIWLERRGLDEPVVSEIRAIPQRVTDKGDEVDSTGTPVRSRLNLHPSMKDETTTFVVTVFNPTDDGIRLKHGVFAPRPSVPRWYMSQHLSSFALNTHQDEIDVPIGRDPSSFPVNITIPAKQSRQFTLRFRPASPEVPEAVKQGGPIPQAWVHRIVGELEFSYGSGTIDGGALTIVDHSEPPTWEQIATYEELTRNEAGQ